MQLNLEDPQSIVRWWRDCPERHWVYLEVFEARSPQFRGAIREARRSIEADVLFSQRRVDEFVDATQAIWASSAWDGEADAQAPVDEAELH